MGIPRFLSACLAVLAVAGASDSDCYPNLLTNSDLETGTPFTNKTAGWFRRACSASLSTDSYTGDSSLKVSGRTKSWAGIAQEIQLEADKNYVFSAYIKLLNTGAGKLTEAVKVTLFYRNSQTGGKKYVHIAQVRYMQPYMWQAIGADFTCLSGYDEMTVYVQTDSPEVDYLLDTSSLTELPPLPWNWAAHAHTDIDNIRKADLNIVMRAGSGNGVHVELSQTSSEFAFGTAVSAAMIVDSQYEKYQDFFTDNFEWATIENKLKWKQTERVQGQLTYDEGVNAVDWLVANGKKVRGHAVFWGVEDKDPEWAGQLEGEELVAEMRRRGQDVTSRTLGKLEHWDVNNENVHGNVYEEVLGEVNATMEIFKGVHDADPNAKLFLNDFGVVSGSTFTQAYVNQARMFKENPSTHIYGLGIQSHLSPPLDLTLLKHRLDALASVGLPLWITELDIAETDTETKAELLEDVLTLYFSHPAVEGVVLWGFWDQKMWKPEAALASGDDVIPNAAGLIWQKLVRQDWRSSATLTMDTGSSSTRAFKGDYSLKVMRGETLLETKQFTLSSEGTTVNIDL